MMDQELSDLLRTSPHLWSLQDDLQWIRRTDVPVLISGELGVGKCRVARWLHALGARRHHPFHKIDCAPGPESHLESELPWWLRGGTDLNGTLYLHEVSELGPRLQTRLLRALSSELRPPRVIAGTSQDLAAATDDTFLPALFYRLNVVHLVIPPLRDYREDIPDVLCRLLGSARSSPALEPEAEKQLVAYDWPGNLDELEAVAHNLVERDEASRITAADLDHALAGFTLRDRTVSPTSLDIPFS